MRRDQGHAVNCLVMFKNGQENMRSDFDQMPYIGQTVYYGYPTVSKQGGEFINDLHRRYKVQDIIPVMTHAGNDTIIILEDYP